MDQVGYCPAHSRTDDRRSFQDVKPGLSPNGFSETSNTRGDWISRWNSGSRGESSSLPLAGKILISEIRTGLAKGPCMAVATTVPGYTTFDHRRMTAGSVAGIFNSYSYK